MVVDITHLKVLDWYNKNITKYTNETFKSNDSINNVYDDIVGGYKEIKSYNLYNKMNNKIEKCISDYRNNFFLKWKYLIMNFTFFPYLLDLVKYFLYIFLIYQVIKGNFELNDLILIITYYELILNYSETFLFNTKEIRMKELSIDRYNDIVKKNEDNNLVFGKDTSEFKYNSIKFINVKFSYSNNNFLNNINLEIDFNKITAITGKNGSGKSTLAKLLLRNYKIDAGEIIINNKNIYDFEKDYYNKNVSILYQRPYLFNMSIKENLLLVNDNFEEVINICKIVGIHDKILKLENGYDTIVEKNGNNISGGEKQLISLARVLLINPKIIIFDEITNNLDLSMQENIIKIIKKLKNTKTIVVITHDPKILKISDNVILMDSGKIVSEGKHNELINKDKDYANLVNNSDFKS